MKDGYGEGIYGIEGDQVTVEGNGRLLEYDLICGEYLYKLQEVDDDQLKNLKYRHLEENPIILINSGKEKSGYGNN